MVTLIHSGSTYSGPIIDIFDGSLPSDQDTTPSKTPLATITLPYPLFSTPSLGIVSFNQIVTAIVSKTGTAAWFRLYDKDKYPIFDGTISRIADTTISDMKMDNLELVQNGIATIAKIVLTFQR
jgi:hypothetical protein